MGILLAVDARTSVGKAARAVTAVAVEIVGAWWACRRGGTNASTSWSDISVPHAASRKVDGLFEKSLSYKRELRPAQPMNFLMSSSP